MVTVPYVSRIPGRPRSWAAVELNALFVYSTSSKKRIASLRRPDSAKVTAIKILSSQVGSVDNSTSGVMSLAVFYSPASAKVAASIIFWNELIMFFMTGLLCLASHLMLYLFVSPCISAISMPLFFLNDIK